MIEGRFANFIKCDADGCDAEAYHDDWTLPEGWSGPLNDEDGPHYCPSCTFEINEQRAAVSPDTRSET